MDTAACALPRVAERSEVFVLPSGVSDGSSTFSREKMFDSDFAASLSVVRFSLGFTVAALSIR